MAWSSDEGFAAKFGDMSAYLDPSLSSETISTCFETGLASSGRVITRDVMSVTKLYWSASSRALSFLEVKKGYGESIYLSVLGGSLLGVSVL